MIYRHNTCNTRFKGVISKSQIRAVYILLLIIMGFLSFVLSAQDSLFENNLRNTDKIFLPDGLRMPGDWNGWSNSTGMGGDFDLKRTTIGKLRWTTTFQFTGTSGNQDFKFVSSSFGDPWGNQWAGNTNVGKNSLTNFTFGAPSDPNNTINVTHDKWYTVIFEDQGYQNTRAIFMETTSEPVAIETLGQVPVLVTNSDAVEVAIELSATPSPEEKFYLRYTTNNWASSAIVAFSLIGANGTASIPQQISGTRVDYYVFSTTVNNPATDFDLLTMRINNNHGNNYAYIVDQQTDCGNFVVTSTPHFPFDNSTVTITFNAEMGNQALLDYLGDVYIHTGVKIIDANENVYDWSYVKTSWGVNTPETKLTRVTGEGNLYTLTINNIRDYYGVDPSFGILQMMMVFRSEEPINGDYLVHRNADWTDIYLNVYEENINVEIINKPTIGQFISSALPISLCVEALESTQVAIYVNDILRYQTASTSFSTLLGIQYFETGQNEVKVIASNGTSSAVDVIHIHSRGAVPRVLMPQDVIAGINYIDDETVTLVLHDPPGLKQYVYVIGDFNDWTVKEDEYMNRTPDGMYFWKTLTGLTPGEEYAFQYLIDDELQLADPYTHKILDPWNDQWISDYNYPNLKSYPHGKTDGIVGVLQTARPPFQWQATGFSQPDVRDLVIYELHVRDFVESDAIKDVTAKLDYLQTLGVNAIELMPINEFEGNDSWGYNPSFYFATDKAYGTREDYKRFIDECHKRGIAVIIDVVLNHSFNLSPLVQMYFDPDAGDWGKPSPDNPWYLVDCPHEPWCWGNTFDQDSPFTHEFYRRFTEYWLTEFNVDGFRFDFTKGLTNLQTGNAGNDYDAARIANLKRIADEVWQAKPGTYVILEHFVANSEETELANFGMLIWGNMNHQYNQATMGFEDESDFSWGLHTSRGYQYHNLISFMESHDEERLMYRNLEYGNQYNPNHNVKDMDVALARNELAAAFYFVAPGPKMIWQFGELGYDYSIEYNGRTGRKPVRWDYYDDPERKQLYDVYSKLIQLKTEHPVFRTANINHSLDTYLKRIHLNENPDGSGMKVTLLGNFDVVGRNINPQFQETGTWYEFFTGNIHQVNNTTDQIWLEPGEYRLYTSDRIYQEYYSKATGNLNDLTTWGTNTEGTGSNPANFSTIRSHYHVRNNATPSVISEWTVSGNFSRLFVGDGFNPVHLSVSSDMNAGILEISGNATVTITSGNTLTVEQWLKNEGAIIVEPGAHLTVQGTLSNIAGLEGLILQSDQTQTGSLIHTTANVPATIQRYIAGGWGAWDEGWHLISSPVAAQAIGDFTTTGTGNDYDFYGWNEAANTWMNYKDENFVAWNGSADFNPGRGYLISYEQQQTDKAFSGVVNVEDKLMYGLSYNENNGNGWQLLGNPFSSAVIWNEGNWALSNVAGTAKIWSSTQKSYSDIGPGVIIPSAQGFMIQVSASSNSVTIPSTARTHSNIEWYKSYNEEILLIARESGGTSAQESTIRVDNNATAGFDFYYDSRFLPGYAPLFYSVANGKRLSTNTLPVLTETTSIPFGFEKNDADEFVIELLETIPDTELILSDLKLGTEHKLSNKPVYSFTSAHGDDPDRFVLHFGAVSTHDQLPEQQPFAYFNNDQLVVKSADAKALLQIYDMQGRMLQSHQLSTEVMHNLPLNLASGIYIVRLISHSKSTSVKLVVP